MLRIRTLVLAAGLLALPFAVQAQDTARTKQQRSRAEMLERTVRPMPVARLIAMRSELQLTDEQVARLTAIQNKYQDLNQPHLDTLRATRREAREKMQAERKAQREANPELAANRKQLLENAKAARAEVEAVLTAEQEALIEQRMQRRRGERGRTGARGTASGA